MTKQKIAYIVPASRAHYGLRLKYEGQLAALQKKYRVLPVTVAVSGSATWLKKLMVYGLFEWCAFLALIRSDKAYVRYNPKCLCLNTVLMLWSFFKPIYLEHNAHYDHELATLNRYVERGLHRFFYRLFRFFPINHITVTRELKGMLVSRGFHDARIQFMQNGYYATKTVYPISETTHAAMQLIEQARRDGKKIGVFIGNGYVWAGLDRMIACFSQHPQVQLVVIGPYNTTKLSQAVYCLGSLNPSEVSHVFAGCDFGIGSFDLALFGVKEASPLKTGEYLWHGLPIVVNYHDSAWDRDVFKPFICPTTDYPAIQAFLQHTHNKAAIQAVARRYLSWDHLLPV